MCSTLLSVHYSVLRRNEDSYNLANEGAGRVLGGVVACLKWRGMPQRLLRYQPLLIPMLNLRSWEDK